MPAPTDATDLQRPDLGTLAWEYMMEPKGFIGLDLFPIFPVANKSADYPVIPIEAFLKVPDTKRTPGGHYNRGDYKFESDTYKCSENGWETPVKDDVAELYRRYFDAEVVAVNRNVNVILRSQEIRIQAIAQNTSNFSNSAVTTEWDTAATCTPRSDVLGAKEAMRQAAGVVPNVGACSKTVFNSLMLSAEILDAFKYTNPIELGGEEVQRRLLAQYLGLDRVLVAGGQYDSAKQGQSFSLSDIWDDEYFGLYNVDSGMDLETPSLGRTFLWEADSPDNVVVEQYRENQTRSEIFRVRHNTDEEIIFAGAGYLLTNITT